MPLYFDYLTRRVSLMSDLYCLILLFLDENFNGEKIIEMKKLETSPFRFIFFTKSLIQAQPKQKQNLTMRMLDEN